MRTTIDRAGRIVIPKELRDRVGLTPGEVEIEVDGSGVRIEPIAGGRIEVVNGRRVVTGGGSLTAETVRALRLADQR